MSIMKLLPAVITLAVAGCAYPSNVANDMAHMGDPIYDNCRRDADPLSDYGARCAEEADPKVQAAKAEQIRQSAVQQRLATETTQQNLAARQRAELAKGYSPITVQNFILDGKKLATRNAKRSLTGVYLPVGNLELLFETNADAIQFSNGENPNSPTVYLQTENASRPFRGQLLAWCSNPASAYVGCNVHVLGRATMCVLSGPFGSQRNVPCVSVDDGSVGGL